MRRRHAKAWSERAGTVSRRRLGRPGSRSRSRMRSSCLFATNGWRKRTRALCKRLGESNSACVKLPCPSFRLLGFGQWFKCGNRFSGPHDAPAPSVRKAWLRPLLPVSNPIASFEPAQVRLSPKSEQRSTATTKDFLGVRASSPRPFSQNLDCAEGHEQLGFAGTLRGLHVLSLDVCSC